MWAGRVKRSLYIHYPVPCGTKVQAVAASLCLLHIPPLRNCAKRSCEPATKPSTWFRECQPKSVVGRYVPSEPPTSPHLVSVPCEAHDINPRSLIVSWPLNRASLGIFFYTVAPAVSFNPVCQVPRRLFRPRPGPNAAARFKTPLFRQNSPLWSNFSVQRKHHSSLEGIQGSRSTGSRQMHMIARQLQ